MNQQVAGEILVKFKFPVERGKVAELAAAGRTPDPLFTDRNAAQAQGLPDCIAPITYPSTFVFHIGAESAVLELMLRLKMNPARSVHGEVQFHSYQPLLVGSELDATLVVSSDEIRTSRNGTQRRHVGLDLLLRDQDGVLVSRMDNIFIETLGP